MPLRRLAAPAARAAIAVAARPATPALYGNAARAFSGAAGKVIKVLQAEIKHEEEQYEQAKEIKAFLKKSEFKLVETDGDVNVTLEREVGDRVVRIEWQLTSPFDPSADVEGGEEQPEQEATNFSVT